MAPYTVIVFAHRKPGMSPAQFKDHWEHNHVPLLKRICGDKFPLAHARHYIQRTPTENAATDTSNAAHPPVTFVGKPSDFDFDAFALLKFEDDQKFQEFFAVVSDPEAAAKIRENEEMFLDLPRMTIGAIDQITVN